MSSIAHRFAKGEGHQKANAIDGLKSPSFYKRSRDSLTRANQYSLPVKLISFDQERSRRLSHDGNGNRRALFYSKELIPWLATDWMDQPALTGYDAFDTDEERGDVTTTSGSSEMLINPVVSRNSMRIPMNFIVGDARGRARSKSRDFRIKNRNGKRLDYLDSIEHHPAESGHATGEVQDLEEIPADNYAFESLNPSQNATLMREMSKIEETEGVTTKRDQFEWIATNDQQSGSNHWADPVLQNSRSEEDYQAVSKSNEDAGESFSTLPTLHRNS